jgi:hypothetical protein
VPQAVRQLEAENRALELRLAELQEEQENQACAIRDAKAEALDAADKGAATKAALQAAKAEAEALRSQIVSAPEAAVTALAEVQAAVERARGRVTAAEAQVRAQHGRREALASLEKEIRKAAGVAGEAQHAVVQRKEASAVLKLAQQRMQENEAEGYRIESEQQHLERTLATLAERQARLEQQGELKVRQGERNGQGGWPDGVRWGLPSPLPPAHTDACCLHLCLSRDPPVDRGKQPPPPCAQPRRRRQQPGSGRRRPATEWRPTQPPPASWRCVRATWERAAWRRAGWCV